MEQSMSKDQHEKAVKVETNLALTEEGSFGDSGFGDSPTKHRNPYLVNSLPVNWH